MQDWLSAQTQNRPDHTALISSERTWTFADLEQAVAQRSAVLSSIGVRPRTRVGLLLNNSADYVLLVLGVLRCGGVVVPLNTRLQPAEIAYQLKNADVRLLLAAPGYHRLAGDIAESLSAEGRQLSAYSSCELANHRSLLPFPNVPAMPASPEYSIDLNAPLGIIHTSGTSGNPKGAVLTYGNIFYSALASAYRLGHLPDDRWLCTLPLFHVGGLSIVLRACLYGITVDLREKFDIEAVNHTLTHDDITLVSLVPTMLYRLLEARRAPWSEKLRLVLLGGAAASSELIERCQAEGIPVAITYGMTEAASQVATALPDLVARKPGTVGKPLMFTQVRIADQEGRDVPGGTYGEVLVKGPTVMQGYDHDTDATKTALKDGWLHTGDIGYLDGDGDLWIVQRRSDLIISGGENIYPAEVETVLRSHPAVRDVAVIGISDPEWGQRVAAAVQLEAGQTLSAEELIGYSRTLLAGYKQPRLIRFVDELPQTVSGKIERKAVLKLFEGAACSTVSS